MTDQWIPEDDWRTIVDNVPIVSVDLVIREGDSILLGQRTNPPAKGTWFVPGGTVFKNEKRTAAVHRVAEEELGVDVEIDQVLGTYEHFYSTADVDVDDGKHYLATAFVVSPSGGEVSPDEQHEQLREFSAPFPELHPYVDRYLDALGLLERDPAPIDPPHR